MGCDKCFAAAVRQDLHGLQISRAARLMPAILSRVSRPISCRASREYRHRTIHVEPKDLVQRPSCVLRSTWQRLREEHFSHEAKRSYWRALPDTET